MTKKASKKARSKSKAKLQLEGVQAPAAATASTLKLNVFSGLREPLGSDQEFTLNIVDGNQKQVYSKRHKAGTVLVNGLKFHDNFGDNHAISISSKDCITVGQAPVALKGGRVTELSLMLVPQNAGYNFRDARWDAITQLPFWGRLLANTDKTSYTNLIEDTKRQPALASLFNLVTAMQQIQLTHGTAAELLTEIVWDEDSIRQDRLFAWADPELEVQVRRSAEDKDGVFAPDAGGGLLHPGSTGSFRQQQFDGTNLQITFHAGDKHPKQKNWIRTEFDIDYFRDPLPHLLFEVFTNTITGSRTDPRNVYVMRWAAGLALGLPNFNPPYFLA